MDRGSQFSPKLGLDIHFMVFSYGRQLNVFIRCLSMRSRSGQAERQGNKQSSQTG